MPSRYLEHFGPRPPRADRTGPAIPSPYRARDGSPRFLPDEVTYLRFRTASRAGIVLAFLLSGVLLSPAAAVLATLWDPAWGLRAGYREDRAAAVLVTVVAAAGLAGGVLLFRQAALWTADRLAARRGTRRWGLYLFPDALVVRWPGGHGATCVPRAAIHGFAYQTFSQAHPDSALVKGVNEPDVERLLYLGLRQAQGVRWIWLDEPEAYRGKGEELARDLNHWAQTGLWTPRPRVGGEREDRHR